MADDFLFSQLNKQQLDIVCRPKEEDILVIAGAGTGKTRVLISRICSLIEAEGVAPESILALTFTNKAAMEMKERLIKAMNWNEDRCPVWLMTFHGLCARLLHMFSAQAMLSSNFSVLGAKDQKHIVRDFLTRQEYSKKCVQRYGLRPKELGCDVDAILKYINKKKEHGIACTIPASRLLEYMSDFDSAIRFTDKSFCEVMYGIYTILCERSSVVDFNELIHRTLLLLRSNADVRSRVNHKFKYILIDEFQDTDTNQYNLLQMLRGEEGRIFVVGDDDQAIYGWRGANYHNLKRLTDNLPDINVMPLSINYRSTQNILNFANSLLSKTEERIIKKRLFTSATYDQMLQDHPNISAIELAQRLPRNLYDPNEPRVVVNRIPHEMYEGFCVTKLIKVLHTQYHVPYSEIAVLYRKNSLSSLIEAELNTCNIPYQIYGGLKFYEREEILNAMAYLRLMCNINDDVALSRVYNVPKRKIGDTSWTRLSEYAASCGCSVYQTVQALKHASNPPREIVTIAKKFETFFVLIERLRDEIERRSLPSLVHFVIKESGLYAYYEEVDRVNGNSKSGTSKTDNLKNLIINADYFMQFASLHDVDIEHADVDEVMPLPLNALLEDFESESLPKKDKPLRTIAESAVDAEVVQASDAEEHATGKTTKVGRKSASAVAETEMAVGTSEVAERTSEEAGRKTDESGHASEETGRKTTSAGSKPARAYGRTGRAAEEAVHDAVASALALAEETENSLDDETIFTQDESEHDPQEVKAGARATKAQSSSTKIKVTAGESGVAAMLEAYQQGKRKSRKMAAAAAAYEHEDNDDDDNSFVKSDSSMLATSSERKAQRKVSFNDYLNDVMTQAPSQNQHTTESKLDLAVKQSASKSLAAQASGALISQGFSALEQLNAFLRSAALTASAEVNVVGQIPLAGLAELDEGLAQKLKDAHMHDLEAELRERAKTDLDALQELEDLKSGKKKQLIDSVQLMTIHASKGLEFEAVIVIGCEEGTLPSAMALKDTDRKEKEALSEERRLAYVAFTRAKRYLVATFTAVREVRNGPEVFEVNLDFSRFLREAEAETKNNPQGSPFVNTPLDHSMNEDHVAKFFKTENEVKREQSTRVTKKVASSAVSRDTSTKSKTSGSTRGRSRRQY